MIAAAEPCARALLRMIARDRRGRGEAHTRPVPLRHLQCDLDARRVPERLKLVGARRLGLAAADAAFDDTYELQSPRQVGGDALDGHDDERHRDKARALIEGLADELLLRDERLRRWDERRPRRRRAPCEWWSVGIGSGSAVEPVVDWRWNWWWIVGG